MRRYWIIGASMLALACSAGAQVTGVATFENFNEGDTFQPAFTDPLSGITFRDSTHPTGAFVIEYSSTEFGGGNYFTAGGYSPGAVGGWGGDFGFAGDLPAAANSVSVDISYPGFGPTALVLLRGFDSSDALVAEQSGPAQAPIPFQLEITSSQFNIARFQVAVPAGFASAYDNIRYTVPEPTVALLASLLALIQRRRCRRF